MYFDLASYWDTSSLKASYPAELIAYGSEKKSYFHKIALVWDINEIQRDNQWIIDLFLSFKSKKLEAATCVFSHAGGHTKKFSVAEYIERLHIFLLEEIYAIEKKGMIWEVKFLS
jgi:hypothetical protein